MEVMLRAPSAFLLGLLLLNWFNMCLGWRVILQGLFSVTALEEDLTPEGLVHFKLRFNQTAVTYEEQKVHLKVA